MTGNVTWEAVLALLAIFGTISGIWWRIENRIERARSDADTKAQAAHGTASLALAQLADFKLEAARTYVGKSDVQQVRDEILGAVDGLKTSLDRMNERLDRVVENSAKRQPVHRG